MLLPELTTLGKSEERATEYLHYRQFFMIWETLERVVEYQSMDGLGMGREVRTGRLADY
jgi:nuclear pore complex protein Nup107